MNQALDQVQSFLFEGLPYRGVLVRLNKSYQTIRKQHQYAEDLSQLLGKALAAVVMLRTSIKLKGFLSLQFEGHEALNLLLAQCTHNFDIRGLMQFVEDKPISTDYFERGYLAINISPDNSTQPYQGIVDATGKRLESALEQYFLQSEQIPTRFYFAVNEDEVIGLMIQQMPGEGDEDQREWLAIQGQLTAFDLQQAFVLTPQELLQQCFIERELRVFDPSPVQFSCNCTRLKMAEAIKTLGYEDAIALVHDHQLIAVSCEYCNKEHTFYREEVDTIFGRHDDDSSDGSVLH